MLLLLLDFPPAVVVGGSAEPPSAAACNRLKLQVAGGRHQQAVGLPGCHSRLEVLRRSCCQAVWSPLQQLWRAGLLQQRHLGQMVLD